MPNLINICLPLDNGNYLCDGDQVNPGSLPDGTMVNILFLVGGKENRSIPSLKSSNIVLIYSRIDEFAELAIERICNDDTKIYMYNPIFLSPSFKFKIEMLIFDNYDCANFSPLEVNYLWINNSTFPENIIKDFPIISHKFFYAMNVSSSLIGRVWQKSRLSNLEKNEVYGAYNSRLELFVKILEIFTKIPDVKVGPVKFINKAKNLYSELPKQIRPNLFYFTIENELIERKLFRDAMKISYVRQTYDLAKEKGIFKIFLYLNKWSSGFQTSFRTPFFGIFLLLITFAVSVCSERRDAIQVNADNVGIYIGKYFYYLLRPWELTSCNYSHVVGVVCVFVIPIFVFMIKHTYNRYSNYKW